MTLIFRIHLDTVNMYQRAKYLGQRSFNSKFIIQTYTHLTDCSTWTTEICCYYVIISLNYTLFIGSHTGTLFQFLS